MTIYINGTSGISGVDGSAGTPALQGTDTNTGISFPAADTVAVNTGGSERVRTDSSGRLLVGTSTASGDQLLVVQGYAGVSAGNAEFGLRRGGNPSAADQGLGAITFQNSAGNSGARIEAVSAGSWTSGSNHRSYLTFSTTADGASSPTERMRISANGDISLSSDNFGIRSHTSFYQSGGDIVQFRANRTNNSGGYFYYNTSNVYGTISDARLKHNIELSSQVKDVEFIKGIEPHTFNFADGTHQLGFIAQNVLASAQNDAQKVAVANWETYDENNPDCPFLGVSVSPIVAALVNTCKAALERIETLEAKVAALESA